MATLTKAHEELYRRTPDETFAIDAGTLGPLLPDAGTIPRPVACPQRLSEPRRHRTP